LIRPISAAATLGVDSAATISNPAANVARIAPSQQRASDIAQLRAHSDPPAAARARLAPDRGAIGRALALARRFAADAQLDEPAANRLAIVVEEWVGNVVEHGGAATGSRIAIGLERRGALVRLTASDAGAAFDPRAVDFEGPNLERGGGAGLALIAAWSRIVDYRRRAGRNRLVLEIPLP
jgi:anti-sigma regulatory factor (Ser/Thr protein kinase)